MGLRWWRALIVMRSMATTCGGDRSRWREKLRVGIVTQRGFGRLPRIDQRPAALFMRDALALEGSAIEVVDVEPSALDVSLLAGLDAAVLPDPHLITDDVWARLRAFTDQGGLVLVVAPAEPSVHVWTDSFVAAFGLGWRIARESSAFPADSPGGFDDTGFDAPMLATIAAELPELTRPVSIFRHLPIEEITPETQVLLRARDGSAWLAAVRPGTVETGAVEGVDVSENQQQAKRSRRGLVVYLASAPMLSWTDLAAKPLIVPLLQEVMVQGVGRAGGSSSTSAGEVVVTPSVSVDAALSWDGVSIGW